MFLIPGSPAGADELSDLRAKAKAGDAAAQHDLGTFYENKQGKGKRKIKDDKQAVSWYAKAADQGLAGAQFDLGRMYVAGKGMTRDSELGVSWQLKAVEQGLASAQFVIGKRYFSGAGMPQDYELALDLFLLAAEQGFVVAQNQLAVIHFKGEGVPKDLVQAHKWFNIASINGYEPAKGYQSVLESIMESEQIEEAQKLASEWVAEYQADQETSD